VVVIGAVAAIAPACGGNRWENVSSLEGASGPILAGNKVKIEPVDFEPVVIPPELTIETFSFSGTLLDDTSDLVLIPTVFVSASSGNEENRLSTSGTLQDTENPIYWKRDETTRNVDIEFLYLPGDVFSSGLQGKERIFLYLTDQEGICASNIVAWPVTFE
jgi:hypothetical protein